MDIFCAFITFRRQSAPSRRYRNRFFWCMDCNHLLSITYSIRTVQQVRWIFCCCFLILWLNRRAQLVDSFSEFQSKRENSWCESTLREPTTFAPRTIVCGYHCDWTTSNNHLGLLVTGSCRTMDCVRVFFHLNWHYVYLQQPIIFIDMVLMYTLVTPGGIVFLATTPLSIQIIRNFGDSVGMKSVFTTWRQWSTSFWATASRRNSSTPAIHRVER